MAKRPPGAPSIWFIWPARRRATGLWKSRILGLFDRQAARIAEKLAAPLVDEHQDARADLAHKLAGSARAVGANAVAAAADNYECCARAGALRPVDVKTLVEAVARVRATLSELAT